MNTRINSSVAKSVDKVIFGNFLKKGHKPLLGKFIPEKSVLENRSTRRYKVKNKGTYSQTVEFYSNPEKFKNITDSETNDIFLFVPKGLVGDSFELSYLGIDFKFSLSYSVSSDKFTASLSAIDFYNREYADTFEISKISQLKHEITKRMFSFLKKEEKISNVITKRSSFYTNLFIEEEPNSSSMKYAELKFGKWKNKTMRRKSYSIFKRFSTINVWPARGLDTFESAAITNSHIRKGFTIGHAKWLKQYKSRRNQLWRRSFDSENYYKKSNSIQKFSRRDRKNYQNFKEQISHLSAEELNPSKLENPDLRDLIEPTLKKSNSSTINTSLAKQEYLMLEIPIFNQCANDSMYPIAV